MDLSRRVLEIGACSQLIKQGLSHFKNASSLDDIKALDEFVWAFLLETSSWIAPPSKIQQSNSKADYLLKLWADRVLLTAEWSKAAFQMYNYDILMAKYLKLKLITDPIELRESNILIYYNTGKVTQEVVELFSLIRILNSDFSFNDIITMFRSNSSKYAIAAVDAIHSIKVDLNDQDLLELIKVSLILIDYFRFG